MSSQSIDMGIGALKIHLKGRCHEAIAKKIKNILGAQRHQQVLIQEHQTVTSFSI